MCVIYGKPTVLLISNVSMNTMNKIKARPIQFNGFGHDQ